MNEQNIRNWHISQ